jgi:ElaB/YqjD/DUF883 family membrane-anchored ribosome-binding protein
MALSTVKTSDGVKFTRRSARRFGNHANTEAHVAMDEASRSFRHAVDKTEALGEQANSSPGSAVTSFEKLVARKPVVALTAALGIGIILGASARK